MNSLACLAVLSGQNVKDQLAEVAAKPGSAFQFTRSSNYDTVDSDRLKAEQSATSDLPLYPLNVEIRGGAPGVLSDSFHVLPFTSPFSQTPAVHLKRTASALAALEPRSKNEQAATIGCLPPFGATFSFGLARPALSNTAPRRQLLPPAKTVMLPQGDPAELRQLVAEMQQKRSQAVEEISVPARAQMMEESSMTARYPVFTFPALGINAHVPPSGAPAQLRSLSGAQPSGGLVLAFKRVSRMLGDLIDKLAVA